MIKAAIAACVLATVAEARALRGLSSSSTSCVQLPPCSSEDIVINGISYQGDSSVAAAVKACEASATCITGKEATIDAASMKIGSCWTVFNGGKLTVASGYTGTVNAARCGKPDPSTEATAIISEGASPSAVMNTGADVVVKPGGSIGTLTLTGGEVTADEGSSISVISVTGGEVKGATGGVTSISMNGGEADLDMGVDTAVDYVGLVSAKVRLAAKSIATLSLTGGTADVTAKSIATLSDIGGTAVIRKATVVDASTTGGHITLEEGATAAKYETVGGSCSGCPKSAAQWRTRKLSW